MPKKLKPLKSLKKKAWKLQSLWLREKAANFQGYAPCFTCEKLFPWKELQVGHFHHGKLDFDLRNLKLQCIACNHYRSGNLGVYGIKLYRIYGLDWLKELEKDANKKGNDYSRKELEEIIEKYGRKNK